MLWDGKVTTIETTAEKTDSVDPYTANPSLHWSKLADSKFDRKRIMGLDHTNNFGSFHSGVNTFTEQSLAEPFEEIARYHIERTDVFRVGL